MRWRDEAATAFRRNVHERSNKEGRRHVDEGLGPLLLRHVDERAVSPLADAAEAEPGAARDSIAGEDRGASVKLSAL